MMTTASSSGTAVTRAETLIQNIDRVAHWLPGYEPLRVELLTAVADMGHRLAADALSRSVILEVQVNVRRLRSSPLRTLLLRRRPDRDA